MSLSGETQVKALRERLDMNLNFSLSIVSV